MQETDCNIALTKLVNGAHQKLINTTGDLIQEFRSCGSTTGQRHFIGSNLDESERDFC
jgi:hypothetical protein